MTEWTVTLGRGVPQVTVSTRGGDGKGKAVAPASRGKGATAVRILFGGHGRGKPQGVGGFDGGDGDDPEDERNRPLPSPADAVGAVDTVDLDSSDDDSECAGTGKGGGNGGHKGPSRVPPRIPGTPPGYAAGTRVSVVPGGCSPPRGYTTLGAPAPSDTNTLYSIEEGGSEADLVATIRRWQDSLAGTHGCSSAADAARGAGPSTSPPAASGGKRGPPRTPTSAEESRYGNSVNAGSPVGSGSVLEIEPPMACLGWLLDASLNEPLDDLVSFLLARCRQVHDPALARVLMAFLSAFSKAALRLYWARFGF